MLDADTMTVELFAGILASLDRLDGKKNRDRPEPKLLVRKAVDRNAPSAIRRLALRLLPPGHPQPSLDALQELVGEADSLVQLEAVRSIALLRRYMTTHRAELATAQRLTSRSSACRIPSRP